MILNSQGHILVGNTIEAPGSWKYPAASSQAGESDLDAACRATFEACGWQNGVHMAAVADTTEASVMQQGEDGSPTEAYQGVCWCAFRCMDCFLDADATDELRSPSLARQDGVAFTFSEVRWQSLPDMLSAEDEEQLASVMVLQRWLEPFLKHLDAAAEAVKLEGKWARSSLACTNCVEYLMALGHPLHRSWELATAPCVKLWQRTAKKGEWHVSSFDMHGGETERAVTFQMGEWHDEIEIDESWSFNRPRLLEWGSAIKFRTLWIAEPDADHEGSTSACNGGKETLLSTMQLAHCTVSTTPLGREEARRFLHCGRMLLRRRFWPEDATETCVSSEEVFFKID